MKKKYNEPKMKVVKIDVADIICTSTTLQSLRSVPEGDGYEFE